MIGGVVLDPTGTGAPGVRVSDGATVARTDRDGRFRLPGKGRFVFVIRPEGMTADRWWRPTPPNDVSVEFRLIPRGGAETNLSLAHVTDLHISCRPSEPGMEIPHDPSEVRAALDGLLSRHPDVSLLAITGDLTDTGLPQEYDLVAETLAGLAAEVLAIPGNHDHMAGEPRYLVTEDGYGVNAGDPTAWEERMGPRWFSLDRGGLHLVAIDWHTHQLGLDADLQDSWLLADLAQTDRPWVLFSHDQMDETFFEFLPSAPVAAFSGHWHTTRTLRLGSTFHVNTQALVFGGLDYSPPAARLVRWSADTFSLETVPTVSPAYGEGSVELSWSVTLPGEGGLASPATDGDRVLGVVFDDDRAMGVLVCLSVETGETEWSVPVVPGVKSSPVVRDGKVVVADVAGGVGAFDVLTGRRLWYRPGTAPLRTWWWTAPAVDAGVVVVATSERAMALGPDEGKLLWERTSLVPHTNFVSHASPVIVGDVVVVGSWPLEPGFSGLAVTDGAARWTVDDPDAVSPWSVEGRGFSMGRWNPVGGLTVDRETGRVIAPAAGGWVCLDGVTGDIVWRAAAEGRFRVARPGITPVGVVVSGIDEIRLLSPADGSTIWQRPLPRRGPARAPYRSTPHGSPAGPAVVDDRIVVAGLDGTLMVFDLGDGAMIRELDLGMAVGARPLVVGHRLILAGVDGRLAAFDLGMVD